MRYVCIPLPRLTGGNPGAVYSHTWCGFGARLRRDLRQTLRTRLSPLRGLSARRRSSSTVSVVAVARIVRNAATHGQEHGGERNPPLLGNGPYTGRIWPHYVL